MEIVEFIRCQLDEDERVAHEAHQPNWCWYTEDKGVVTHVDDDGEWDRYLPANTRSDAEHIALHDPARVLREVEAKRKILQWCAKRYESCDGPCFGSEDTACDCNLDEHKEQVLRLLALPYSDLPGYRSEWAPSDT